MAKMGRPRLKIPQDKLAQFNAATDVTVAELAGLLYGNQTPASKDRARKVIQRLKITANGTRIEGRSVVNTYETSALKDFLT